jgi:hypothetical protein
VARNRLALVPEESYAVVDCGFVSPCWIWQRGKIGGGYGAIKSGGRVTLAHRYFYEKQVGEIPDGDVLHHLCWRGNPEGYRACCNPHHLEPRSRRDNAREGVRIKLSVEDAAAIRAEIEALAARYDVTVGTLLNLVKPGGNWR